jgi:hypothetical protein
MGHIPGYELCCHRESRSASSWNSGPRLVTSARLYDVTSRYTTCLTAVKPEIQGVLRFIVVKTSPSSSGFASCDIRYYDTGLSVFSSVPRQMFALYAFSDAVSSENDSNSESERSLLTKWKPNILLGYSAVLFRWSRPSFQRCILPPSSGRTSAASVDFNETTRRCIPEGYIICMLAAVRTWNLTR